MSYPLKRTLCDKALTFIAVAIILALTILIPALAHGWAIPCQ